MDLKKKNASCMDMVMIRTLGSGYNAKVKLAFDKNSGKYVAVKIIKKIDRNNLKTLQNELNVMMELKHENIIELLDVQENKTYVKKNGQTKTVTFIVIELAEGGELFDYVANTGAFNYPTARAYFHQLLDALQYAHSKNIAHRDLKPENLLFDSQFKLKVADWGFATVCADKNSTVLGTESYMAPEIHLKMPYQAKQVDLFASAIVLFIMVVGTPPFTRADTKDPYYNLLVNGKADRFWQQHLKFKSKKDAFSTNFKDMITKMLQYDPSKRMSLQEVREHAWMQEETLTQSELTQQFSQKKIVVDQEIEAERQKKQMEKQRQPNHNANTAIQGFRSGDVSTEQAFTSLEDQFTTLTLTRQIPSQKTEKPNNNQFINLYSSMQPELFYKYLLVTLLNENIPQDNITLSQDKYKLEFTIQDDLQNIIVSAEIQKLDEMVNLVEFKRKSGNSIEYFKHMRNIKDAFNVIKNQL